MSDDLGQLVGRLKAADSDGFVLSVDDSTGAASVLAGSPQGSVALGCMEVLDHQIIPSHENPFPVFEKFQVKFSELKDGLTDFFEVIPKVEGVIDAETQGLFTSILHNLTYAVTKFSFWSDAENDAAYCLLFSTSEEPSEYGYLAILSLCRLD